MEQVSEIYLHHLYQIEVALDLAFLMDGLISDEVDSIWG